MAFVKLFYVIQDSPVGYQTVNQLAANTKDLHDRLETEHGTVEYLPGVLQKGGKPVFDFNVLGRHNTEEVPRSVGVAELALAPAATIGVSFNWAGPGIGAVWKVGTGDYLIPVVGLSRFRAKVSHRGSSTIMYLPPQVRPFYPSAANGNNVGIRVRFFKLDAGDFVAADNSFSIALYGTP